MGVPFSCPLADLDDLGRQFETFLVRSMSFDSTDVRTALRSVSFNGRDSEPVIVSSFGSGKMVIQGSLSFKGRELGTTISFRAPSDVKENAFVRSSSAVGREKGENLPTGEKDEKLPTGEKGEKLPTDSVSERGHEILSLESSLPRYQAALRLQKVYKSFRTRRQLADCAVLVEQRWWRLLDFAELKHSSISFFDIEKPETAVSRWSRARTRAAKVGKGLSKDERARKLALQHWLEAIDPRHRYGHNLQCYYNKWLHCESKQPFFYWLDIGEGKEVSLDRCSRSKLQQQCIKYLGPVERKAYEVVVEDGKFFHKQARQLLDTRGGPQDAKWIFVLSTSRTLYVGQKHKGTFQHSSFLAGGATLSAGRVVVEDGVLKAVWPHSGHYRPTEENFEEFMLFLKERNVDLSIVQKSPTDDEEPNVQGSEEKPNSRIRHTSSQFPRKLHSKISQFPGKLHSKITALQIPKKDDVIKMFKEDEPDQGPPGISRHVETPSGYKTADEYLSSSSEEGSDYEEPPEGNIILRINPHKGIKSYQLAHMLSCKWTTGAGPRIGCVRDYPLEVQNRALEEVNLSPRSSGSSSPRRWFLHSPRFHTPTRLSMDTTAGRSPLASSSKI